MRIGIDAKWLYTGPVSGKVVVKNIIENYPLKKNLFLFVKKQDFEKANKDYGKKFNIVSIPIFINSAFTNFFILPFYIKKFNLHCMIYQTFGSIFFFNRSAVYVFDLLFLEYPQFFSNLEKVYFHPILKILKLSKLILTISYSEKKRIAKYLKDKKKIKAIHLSADHFKKIESIKPKGMKNIKDYILYVGRFNERKNLKILLNIINLLDDNKIKLLIVGNRSHKFNSIDKLIELNGIKKRVKFINNAKDTNIKWLYKNAKLFCFPSYAEGFGLPPLEAMTHGCPVIISNINSHREIFGSAALYFNPNNPLELSHKINKILNNKKLYTKYKKRGFTQSKKFNWKKSSIKIDNLINKYFI